MSLFEFFFWKRKPKWVDPEDYFHDCNTVEEMLAKWSSDPNSGIPTTDFIIHVQTQTIIETTQQLIDDRLALDEASETMDKQAKLIIEQAQEINELRNRLSSHNGNAGLSKSSHDGSTPFDSANPPPSEV